MIFKNLKEAKHENINQIQLYLHFFKIPKGILLYINKDTLELKEFLVNYNPTLVQALLRDLSVLKEKLDSNTVPQRIPEYPKNWQCRYCQFKEICTITGEDEIGWNDFKKKIKND